MISVNQWVYDLEKKIFSIVKSRASEKLSGKYPNIYFTDIEQKRLSLVKVNSRITVHLRRLILVLLRMVRLIQTDL